MPLEPATAAILAAIAESGAPEYHELPVAESRAIYTESQSVPPTVAVYSVEDIMVDGPAGIFLCVSIGPMLCQHRCMCISLVVVV